MWLMYFTAFITLLVAFAFACKFTTSVFTWIVAIAVVTWTVFPVEADVAGAPSVVGATFSWVIVVVVLGKESHDVLY